MYELKCPSCGHVAKSLFVRVGAVGSCEQCKHRYIIHEAHVARRIPMSATTGSGADRVSDVHREDDRAAPKTESMVGLSGLSEKMRASGEGASSRRQGARSASASSSPASGGAAQQEAEPATQRWARSRRRRQWPIYITFILLLVVVVGLGFGLWQLNQRGGNGADAGGNGGGRELPLEMPIDTTVTGAILDAQQVEPLDLVDANEGDAGGVTSEHLIVAGQSHRDLPDGRTDVRVQLENTGDATVIAGRLDITWPNDSGASDGWRVPIHVITPDLIRNERVVLPGSSGGVAPTIYATVTDQRGDVIWLDRRDLRVTEVVHQGGRLLRITGRNYNETGYDTAHLLISGFDAGGDLAGRWLLIHRERIGGGGRIELAVRLPGRIGAGSITRWRAEGAGWLDETAQ